MTRIASGWIFFLAPAVAHFMWMTRGGNEAKVVFSENPNEADQKMFLEMIASRTSLRVGVAPAPFLTPLSFALKTLPGSSRGPRGELVSDPLPKNLATSGAVLEAAVLSEMLRTRS